MNASEAWDFHSALVSSERIF